MRIKGAFRCDICGRFDEVNTLGRSRYQVCNVCMQELKAALDNFCGGGPRSLAALRSAVKRLLSDKPKKTRARKK